MTKPDEYRRRTDLNETSVMCFQDVLQGYFQEQEQEQNKPGQEEEENDDDDDGNPNKRLEEQGDVSSVFFELANAPLVSYRFQDIRGQKRSITIQQDFQNAGGQHTGGIVWETAYLLLNYLLTSQDGSPPSASSKTNNSSKLFKTLELGAGCGMVGQVLYAAGLAKPMIVTEAQPVMANLLHNLRRNQEMLLDDRMGKNTSCDNHHHNHHHHHHQQQPTGSNLSSTTSSSSPSTRNNDLLFQAHTLDWTNYKHDCTKANIEPHSIDTILGTDVVFSPTHVEPLLQTITYLAHSKTTIYLFVQKRCPDAYRILWKKATDVYGLEIKDISSMVTSIPTCRWGQDLDCRALKLTRKPNANHPTTTTTKKRKR